MESKVCPFMSNVDVPKACIEDACMMWVEGNTSSTCALVKLPRKTVTRLDTISAQLQELQILVNQIAGK